MFEQKRLSIIDETRLPHKAYDKCRTLGASILFAAIQDYRCGRGHVREDAQQFLYPSTQEYVDHFDWAVSMTDGVDRAWLRGTLDKMRFDWDRQWQRTMRVQ